MKQASIHLHLSKETAFDKHNVTPMEAMLLVAMHHVNKGDNPCIVDTKTIKDTPDVKDGKPIARSNDQEADRLRSIYGSKKVNLFLNQVRDLPDTFDAAIERGLKLAMPSDALSSGVASSMKL